MKKYTRIIRERFTITEDSKLLDNESKTLYVNGELDTYLSMNDGTGVERKFYLRWVYTYLKFKFPSSIDIRNIIFVPISVYRKIFPYKAIFIKPVYYRKIYRIIPSFPDYAISKYGECVNWATNRVMKHRKNPYGYSVVGLRDNPTNEYRDVGVHWLVANAWVLCNQDSAHQIVNHKDCDKQNDDCNNLEWVSHKENTAHAVAHDLVGLETPCTVTDLRTNTNYSFNNLTDAASKMDVDVSLLKSIKFHVKKPLISERFRIRFGKETGVSEIAASNIINRDISIEVKNGDKVEIYDSIREISRITGICRSTVTRLVNSNGKLSFRNLVMRRKTAEAWPATERLDQAKRVVIHDRNSDKITTANSIKEASLFLKLSKHTIKRMMRHPLPTDKFNIGLIDS